jgi:hypothetical protein
MLETYLGRERYQQYQSFAGRVRDKFRGNVPVFAIALPFLQVCYELLLLCRETQIGVLGELNKYCSPLFSD